MAQHGESLLSDPIRLTSPADFSRSGEAYLAPDGKWIIFQAEPAGERNEPPRYAMFVAKLDRDASGTVTGLGETLRLS
ncbi:MAG: hypothetical protein AAGJ54_12205 [Planctomycetota bacterium]